jgi:hypothetical protein
MIVNQKTMYFTLENSVSGIMNNVTKAFLGAMILFIVQSVNIQAQGTNFEFEKVKIGEAKNMLAWLSLAPDGKSIAVSSTQSFPLYIFNWETQQVEHQFDVGNWYAGSRASYSKNGKYVLLQQLFYMDYAPNKDKEVNFEVFDAHTGQSMLNFGDYQDAKITPDEKYLVTLNGGVKVGIHEITTRKEVRSFSVQQATNSLAISSDGQYIAVSHKTYMEDLLKNPIYVNNKKNRPIYEDYKQQVSVYDFETGKLVYTIDAFYDLVYRMEYTNDGNYLFVYSIPHTKLQGPNGRKSYVEVVNAKTGEPYRQSFGCLANYEPDFKMSHSNKYFGITSLGVKFPELHIYDFETNEMVKRFELSYRLFEKTDEAEFPSDGRVSFIFLPGDEEVVMTFGNRLIHWKLDLQ